MVVGISNGLSTDSVVGYDGIVRELNKKKQLVAEMSQTIADMGRAIAEKDRIIVEKDKIIEEMSSILSFIRVVFSENESWKDDPELSKVWDVLFQQ